MERSTQIVIAALGIFIVVLSIMSFESDETVLENAKITAQEVFEGEEIEANYDGEGFSLNKPDNLDIVEEDANNLVLLRGEQVFLVFYNPLEAPTSQLNFEQSKKKDSILLESFDNGERFGYIRVIPDEDKLLELQVSIGGVKVTTVTTKSNLIKDTEESMKITRSVYDNK